MNHAKRSDRSNQDGMPPRVLRAVRKLCGESTLPILMLLSDRTVYRYKVLRSSLPWISQHRLEKGLKKLIADKLVRRRRYAKIPPRSDYALTARGKTLKAVLGAIKKWCEAKPSARQAKAGKRRGQRHTTRR